MSIPLVLAYFWALAATVTAFLPMRFQIAPGLVLLAAAPVLIVWIGVAHGGWFAVAGLAAFLSMFRRPIAALLRHLTGRRPPRSGAGGEAAGDGASGGRA